jgi:type VI protein secretion system component VasF
MITPLDFSKGRALMAKARAPASQFLIEGNGPRTRGRAYLPIYVLLLLLVLVLVLFFFFSLQFLNL